MSRLKNKVAIITGGSGGIGVATAQRFLEEGAKVMLVDLHETKLEEVARELDHPDLSYCVADVSMAAPTEVYIEKTLSQFGRIDVFFANAGIEGKVSPISDYPEEMFDKVIAVNLKGVWLGCHLVVPKMEDGGSVMITSSVAGLKGFQGLGAYVASKHGVIGIMRVAALELAEKGIRVNTIHPGPVDNEMMRRVESQLTPEDPGQAKQGFESQVPLNRYATSGEVADLAVFLASDESKYITGCCHVIDGGMITA